MKALKGHWMSLPKGRLNFQVLRGLTTYEYPDKTVVSEIQDAGDSWVVPRELFSDKELDSLGIQVEHVRGEYRDAFQQTLALSHKTAATERQRKAQKLALEALLKEGGGVVQLSPGSGKTALGLMAARHWGHPTLVVVHTTDLQSQWKNRAVQLLGMDISRIGTIDGNGWDYAGKDMVIAIVHSLAAHTERHLDLREFGTVIYDEVHHMKAPTFRLALPLTRGRRIGISATPKVEGLENLFFHHIGPLVYRSEETDLDPTVLIKSIQTNLGEGAWKRINKFVYTGHLPPNMQDRRAREVQLARTMNEVAESPEILQEIAAIVRELAAEGRKQLILSDRVSQLEALKEVLGDSASLLTGKVKAKNRDEALHGKPIVCATTSLALEGLDRPEFDTLHVCFPWTSDNRLVQGFGRILRAGVDKQEPLAVLYDFGNIPMLHRMLETMRKNCRRKGYSIHRDRIA